MSCKICSLKIGRDICKINCSECGLLFHAKCAKLKPSDVEHITKSEKTWNCKVCVQQKKNNLNRLSLSSSFATNNVSLSADDLTLEGIHLKVMEIKNTLASTLHSLGLMQAQISTLEETTRLLSEIQKENEMIKAELKTTRERLDNAEYMYHSKHIELREVPFFENENVCATVIKILNKGIDMQLTVDDVEMCYRKKIKGAPSGTVIVQLRSRSVKEEILAALYAKKVAIKAETIFSSCKGRIFINDWLSNNTKMLMREAKIAKTNHNYEFLWVRYGKIMMRKTAGMEVKFIRCIDDLNHL